MRLTNIKFLQRRVQINVEVLFITNPLHHLNASFFRGYFSAGLLINGFFIIVVIFEVESNGAGKRLASSTVRCSRMPHWHGFGFCCYSCRLGHVKGESIVGQHFLLLFHFCPGRSLGMCSRLLYNKNVAVCVDNNLF